MGQLCAGDPPPGKQSRCGDGGGVPTEGRELLIQQTGALEVGQRLPTDTSIYTTALLCVESLSFAYSGISLK